MISAIIMASGFSKRMGRDKLLLEIDGLPMIERVIQKVKNSNVQEIILVYRKELVKNIGEKYEIYTVYNPYAQLGQSEAMKIGIKNTNLNSKGYMFVVGDQPFISSNAINTLINEFIKNKEIVVPTYDEKRGSPVIFSSHYRDSLLMINGDIGGREVIDKNIDKVKFIEMDKSFFGEDIDTLQDYKRLTGMELINK
ncbi:molybdenum hydroxylase accessory protein, YgfJ family [Gottschalkia purinilytica]|uniref:Molybdenum hydroxylase accessory protein, YgfJ family n=1 Tax=Gottschalkia purinilytica TaxID=1503 RepID=A0A0L0W6F1_GOTPU|nr:molybdenum cofactor cytidylyltransferase [Gottschalkia purinilytica]KNF07099.1 molybdenum hydroxylase accessory protein, YgfJ family [Gottschalkia purinilytica]